MDLARSSVGGSPNLVVGYSGSAKSLATLAAGIALAAGTPIWGQFPTRPRRVLYLSKNSGSRAVRGRAARLARGMGIELRDIEKNFVIVPFPRVPLTDRDAVAAYRDALDGYDACFMDALRGFVPGVDEKEAEIRDYIDPLTETSEVTSCAVVLICHEKKGGQTAGKFGGRDATPDDEAARGSAGIQDAEGCSLRFLREEHDGRHMYAVRQGKQPEEPPGPWLKPFYLQIEDVPDNEAHDLRWGMRLAFQTEEQVKGAPAKPGDKFTGDKAQVLAYVRAETRANRAVPVVAVLAKAIGVRKEEVTAAVEQRKVEGLVEDRPEKCGRGAQKPRRWAKV